MTKPICMKVPVPLQVQRYSTGTRQLEFVYAQIANTIPYRLIYPSATDGACRLPGLRVFIQAAPRTVRHPLSAATYISFCSLLPPGGQPRDQRSCGTLVAGMSVTVASVLCAGLAGTARVARQPLGLCLAAPPAGGAVCIVPAVRQRRGNGARGKVRAARARASIRDQLEGMSWLSLDSGLVDHSDVQQTTVRADYLPGTEITKKTIALSAPAAQMAPMLSICP